MSQITTTDVFVLHGAKQEFKRESVNIGTPEQNEVLVEVVASGFCHSDLNILHGTNPGNFPAVLGHEGTGIVRQVGPGVRSVKAGDKVVLCWTHCEECGHCLDGKKALCDKWFPLNLLGNRTNGKKTWTRNGTGFANFLSQGSFSKHLLIEETGVIKVSDDADLVQLAAGVGCGIMTGAGTVFNAFHGSRVGSSIAVFGVGAVGAGAIMAARNGHYSKIIAVDLHQHRLDVAKQIGATHTIRGDQDVAKIIQELGGVDYAVEATGVPKVLETAYNSLCRGGTAAVVGIAPMDKTLGLPIFMHMQGGKKIVGVPVGDAHPRRLIPFLVELVGQGRMQIDLLSKTFKFDDIEAAVQAMEDGSVIKPVLVW